MLLNIRQFMAAFWLALILLVVASVPLSGQQPGGNYDPWLDYNGDGKINAADLSSMAQSYGAEGDPIRNVTIIGHATKLIRVAVDIALSPRASWYSGLIWVDGYAKMTTLISLIPSPSNKFDILAYDYTGLSGSSWALELPTTMGAYWVKTYDVVNQQIMINVNNTSTDTPSKLNVDVYLMA